MPLEYAEEETGERSCMFKVWLLEDEAGVDVGILMLAVVGVTGLEMLLPYRVKGTSRLSLAFKSKL